jgi:glycosyltransferase involved in cell wall biosynthesis
MFQKIVALKKAGIKIHLHYFKYGDRGNNDELNKYCESIQAYERKMGAKGLRPGLPYIVSSRNHEDLISNLKKDDFPILIEGIHCTGILESLEHKKRKILVRLHNDESTYYKKLSASEKKLFKKIFFWQESHLLKRYQSHLPKDCLYVCISGTDVEIFKEIYHLPNIEFLPAFVAWREIKSIEGVGNFCLYHGNLAVPENEKAACWLLDKVFTKVKLPLVIAGKNPSNRLNKMAHLCQHTCLVANPSEKEMNDLVQKAHINILPSFNTTGVKLKLLHALFEGRHCIVNDAAVNGSELEPACHISNSADHIASIVAQLYHLPFTEEEICLRKRILYDLYDNGKNAEKIIAWLY